MRRKTIITEIEPLIMPFDPLLVTTSKREYREAVRRMGEEPGDPKGKDGLTSCIPGKGCVVWISRKVKAPDLYAVAVHEATHAACDMLASIGEDTPAAEELAYMVQTVAEGIIAVCEGRDDG